MNSLQKANDRIKEYNQGFMVEYEKPDGSIGLFNKLDYEMAKKYKQATYEEKAEREYDHKHSTIIYVLIIVIVIMLMILIYVNMMTDLTGIYYDGQGNKIVVHHTKTLGKIKLNDKEGVIKKINSGKYGIYQNEDMITNKLEELSRPMAAYADIKTGNIVWKNDIWKLDRNGYKH